jgi:enoyl-CoA hydratase/carnithine racemase
VTGIRVERQGPVAHVILDRPGKLNALRPEALSVLQATVRELDSDRSVRVVVLSGAGRAFCTGVDLGTVDGDAGVGALSAEIALQMQDTLAAIENSAVPWIAAVHGIACAGGLELTLACDVVVAAEGTRLGDVHARYGLFPGGGASQRLPRLVGERRARWLLLSGDWIDAAKAARWGLVTEVVPAGQLLDRANEMAGLLARRSPLLAEAIKQALRVGAQTSLPMALQAERPIFRQYMASEHASTGLRAFMSQTEPVFDDR